MSFLYKTDAKEIFKHDWFSSTLWWFGFLGCLQYAVISYYILRIVLLVTMFDVDALEESAVVLPLEESISNIVERGVTEGVEDSAQLSTVHQVFIGTVGVVSLFFIVHTVPLYYNFRFRFVTYQ